MRRLFWFAAGAAAGAFAVRKIQATARKATPAGIAENLGGAMRELASAVGSFGAEVRAGMAEREDELHELLEPRDVRVIEYSPEGTHRAYSRNK